MVVHWLRMHWLAYWLVVDDSLVIERGGSITVSISDWRAVIDETGRGLKSMVNFVPNLINLHLSVQIPSHDVICLNERIKLSLEILILLLKEGRMLLKSLILCFEVKVSVHQRLVGVVNSFKISVLSSLLNFKAIVFRF